MPRDAWLEGEGIGVSRLSGSRPFWIGRSRSSDLVVPSSSVSRRHAVVEWRGNGYHIHDILSHNGTFVNGRRRARHRLRPGDVIRIGEWSLRYCERAAYAPGGRDLRESSFVREGRVDEPSRRSAGRSPAGTRRRAILRGELDVIGLDQIIPFLELHGRNGVLEVHGDGCGRIWFDRGCVVQAKAEGVSGLEAFYRILEQRGGRFLFQEGAARVEARIRLSATALILESMRRRDEGWLRG